MTLSLDQLRPAPAQYAGNFYSSAARLLNQTGGESGVASGVCGDAQPARGAVEEDVGRGRRAAIDAGGFEGVGGTDSAERRGGWEDTAELLELERHSASESPSAESELAAAGEEQDAGWREDADRHAPRQARRQTANLGAAPHASAWPTILGRGPVSLIEKFPVSSPDGGGNGNARAEGEGEGVGGEGEGGVGGGGEGGDAVYLPLRGDGTNNVYHPYIRSAQAFVVRRMHSCVQF